MIKYFVYGSLLYSLLTGVYIVIAWFICRISKEKFAFPFDWYSFGFNLIGYGVIFSSLFSVFDKYFGAIIYQIIIGVLFVTLIVSYFHIIVPIRHLFNVGKTRYFFASFLPKELYKDYHFKVVDKPIVNAFSTGILPFSKIILIGKPLVENLSDDELYSIILHEVGHLKKRHLIKLYGVILLVSLVNYFLLYGMLQFLQGLNNTVLELIIVGAVAGFTGFMLWFVPGKFQYRMEYEADAFAAKENGVDNMSQALKHLDQLSDFNVTKGGISHPTLIKRLENINSL